MTSNLITKRVVGQARFRRGDEVCVSGSWSGTRCEGVIDHSETMTLCFTDGTCSRVLVTVASHRRGSYLARRGDSGARVHAPVRRHHGHRPGDLQLPVPLVPLPGRLHQKLRHDHRVRRHHQDHRAAAPRRHPLTVAS